MGAGNSQQKKVKPSKYQPAINKDEWELQARTDNGTIYRDRNGREAQENRFTLDNRYSPAAEFDVYEQRRRTQEPIVKAYGAEFTPSGSALVPKNQFRALTERIPHRLSNVPQITYPESLHVLDNSLQGYQHLYKKTGAFNVNADMIGFTPEGETRVWFNQNYAENHPSSVKNILQSTLEDRHYLKNVHYNSPVSEDESAMVKNIAQVIEDKTQEGIYPDDVFRSNIYRDRVGFEQARSIIRNTYTERNFIPINHLDFYRNTITSRGGQHIVSRPEFATTTTHHESYVRPVVASQPLVQETVMTRAPVVETRSYETRTVQAPVQNTIITQQVYQPPAITTTTNTVNTGAVFTNAYRPMESAKKNTGYRFNYEQPKELFHPDMYTGGHRHAY